LGGCASLCALELLPPSFPEACPGQRRALPRRRGDAWQGMPFFSKEELKETGRKKNEKLARNHFFSTPEKAFNHPAVFQG
jgi:hypothetical protein